jgi:hypothetical protein
VAVAGSPAAPPLLSVGRVALRVGEEDGVGLGCWETMVRIDTQSNRDDHQPAKEAEVDAHAPAKEPEPAQVQAPPPLPAAEESEAEEETLMSASVSALFGGLTFASSGHSPDPSPVPREDGPSAEQSQPLFAPVADTPAPAPVDASARPEADGRPVVVPAASLSPRPEGEGAKTSPRTEVPGLDEGARAQLRTLKGRKRGVPAISMQ